MSDIAILKPFRKLARTANFARNIDELFKDFFLTPLSLESTDTIGGTTQQWLDEPPEISKEDCQKPEPTKPY